MTIQPEQILEKQFEIQKILSQVDTIVKHSEQVSKLKGENFNIFRILKMDACENETHSAFLSELLNPHGSHNMGSLFLEYFVETIDVLRDNSISNTPLINYDSAKVIIEKDIGKIDLKENTGGRIDILIYDGTDNNITIENKIYAPDQNAQVVRYSNYKKENNTVLYLTLFGNEPSRKSKGNLTEGKDFYCISYKNEILEWLQKCLKESAEHPILRESIKQYIILIKKLTFQLTNNLMDKEIQELIKQYYPAAKVIEKNVKKVEYGLYRDLYKAIAKSVSLKLDKEKWIIELEADLWKSYKGLIIRNINWHKSVCIKLEPQSKLSEHNSVYGIIANRNIFNRDESKRLLSEVVTLEPKWGSTEGFPFYKYVLFASNEEERLKMTNDDYRSEVETEISDKLVKLALITEMPLSQLIPMK